MKRPDGDEQTPRYAEDFFNILDELAGIPKDASKPSDDDVQPVPLSEGTIERAIEQIHRIEAAKREQERCAHRCRFPGFDPRQPRCPADACTQVHRSPARGC